MTLGLTEYARAHCEGSLMPRGLALRGSRSAPSGLRAALLDGLDAAEALDAGSRVLHTRFTPDIYT
jgi:hypothetical protein